MSKILIIEDEKEIAELEKDYLEINGYEVAIESKGDSGLLRAKKEKFDLIVLDLMLPNMDGFEICKEIRKEQNIPILMVTARTQEEDKLIGEETGADEYITKPFELEEVVKKVEQYLK